MNRRLRWDSVCVVAWMVLGASACALQPQDEVTRSEATSSATQSLTTTDTVDGSGTVKVRIKTCDWTTSKTVNCAYCAVDPGWVRIGGGAEIEGESSDARLKASFPSLDPAPISNCSGNGDGMGSQKSTWVARSAGSSNHRLRAYVIAMQLVGLNSQSLESQVTTFESTTTAGTFGQLATWSAGLFYPSDLLIGGGSEIVFNTANGYLTESRPWGGGWQGSATFATNPPDGGLKIYSTGIPQCPSGWTGCLRVKQRNFQSVVGTGYLTATLGTPFPWVTASVGAIGYNAVTNGRYLADLIPFNGSAAGATVRTKDHGTSNTGRSSGYLITIEREGGVANFNAVRQLSGANMSRSPNVLKQSTATPQPDDQKWHLESVGGGAYRLRNGNPGSGTECAFYKPGSASGRMAACGSGNEFKWTVFSGSLDFRFQLRNVASGTCLDNNGIGYANGDLLLKPCVTGAGSQHFFLDAYNWPL